MPSSSSAVTVPHTITAVWPPIKGRSVRGLYRLSCAELLVADGGLNTGRAPAALRGTGERSAAMEAVCSSTAAWHGERTGSSQKVSAASTVGSPARMAHGRMSVVTAKAIAATCRGSSST
eukprot:6146656-Prymnesium_polylepis.4